MSLSPLHHWNDLARVLACRKVIYDPGIGWAGDRLIDQGTRIFFDTIGVIVVDRWEEAEDYVWGGGGNLGHLWDNCYQRRHAGFRRAREHGLRCVVLPQSFTPGEPESFPENSVVFARERVSQVMLRDVCGVEALLAPDMALYLGYQDLPWEPIYDVGHLFRVDCERSPDQPQFDDAVDPRQHATGAADLLMFVNRYRRIMTDRLHVAIAGLMLGREVSLFPNRYHKNLSMYIAWLASLGCHWQTTAGFA